MSPEPTAAEAATQAAAQAVELAEDWRDIFYLGAFLHLSAHNGSVPRRKQVWIKRFIENRGKPHLYRRMDAFLKVGHADAEELRHLTVRAAAELSAADKRRFVYNLAQLFQSRGALSSSDYEAILDFTAQLGIADTAADAMLHAVYRINDTFLAVLGLLACGTIIYLTRTVLIPLVIAVFIAMIISRVDGALASAFKVRRLRWLTKLGAMLLILGATFGLVMVAVVSGNDIAQRLPEYGVRAQATLNNSVAAQSAMQWLEAHGIVLKMSDLPIGTALGSVVTSVIGLISDFMLVVIFAGFLVSSNFTGLMAEMNKKTGTYIAAKTLMSVITGATVLLLCWAFGVDFALFWALLAFLLNYIPVVGAVASAVLPVALAVVQLSSWAAVVGFAASLLIVGVLQGQVLEPKLMGNRLAIKPIAVLFGLIFWGLLWGIPGMFLATPLMVLLRILASHFQFSRGFERLLATETT